MALQGLRRQPRVKRTKAYESGQLLIYDPKLRAFARQKYYPIIQWVGALERPGGKWDARIYFKCALRLRPVNIKAKSRADVERQIDEIAFLRCQYIET